MAALTTFVYNYPVGTFTPTGDLLVGTNILLPNPVSDLSWSIPSGYYFLEWNTAADGTGYSGNAGEYPSSAFYDAIRDGSAYAIWAEEIQDVVITYKGNTIATTSTTSTKTIKTKGTYCEDDITVTYTRPGTATTTTSIIPTEAVQTVAPAAGYVGFNQVTVAGITSTYVGTGITRRSTADLTVSGPTITAPAGYYAASAASAVATVAHDEPILSTSLSDGYFVVSAIHAQSTGYVNGGTLSTSASMALINPPNPTLGYTAESEGVEVYASYELSDGVNLDISTKSTSFIVPYAQQHDEQSTGTVTVNGLVEITTPITWGFIPEDTQGTTTYQLSTNAGGEFFPIEGDPGTSDTIAVSGDYLTGDIQLQHISPEYTGSAIGALSVSVSGPTVAGTITGGSGIIGVSGEFFETVDTGTLGAPSMDWAVDATNQVVTISAVGVVSSEGWVDANTSTPSSSLSFPFSWDPAPSVTINSTTGLITASHLLTSNSFYVGTGATISSTLQLTVKGAQTYTPTTSAQTITSGVYLTGAQTIAAIPSQYKDTSDGDAVSSEILSGKVAYNSSGKVTGTMTSRAALSKTMTISSPSFTAANGYYPSITATVSAVTTTVMPSSASQLIMGDNSAFLSSVAVEGDQNLVASNIKAGTSIFGVTGTYTGSVTQGTLSLTINDPNNIMGLAYYIYYPEVYQGNLTIRSTTGLAGTTYNIPTCYWPSTSSWHGSGQYLFVDCSNVSQAMDVTVNSNTNANAYAFNNGPRNGCLMIWVYGPNAILDISLKPANELQPARGETF